MFAGGNLNSPCTACVAATPSKANVHASSCALRHVALPSVRQLAAELRVNPATIIQAYRDLEAQGFVEIRHGAGTFVRELAPGRRARERSQQAAALVRKLLADARRSGVSLAELHRALEAELGGKTP